MDEGNGKHRLFTAIELPEQWLDTLGRLRGQLERVGGSEFKWVRTELMHITLVFLGYQDIETAPAISAALGMAGTRISPFDLRLGHTGTFGPPHALSVVWAGIDRTPPEMQALHASISDELSKAGIAFDHKPLVPHVTLARGRRSISRDASLKVASALKQTELPGLTASISSFVLMRSRLSPRGPSYEVLQRFPLSSRLKGASDPRNS